LAKIRSLFTLPFLFALMLYKALVRGAQSYGSELWLPLVETRAADRTLVTFMQQLFFLHKKTGHYNAFLLANMTPFSVWARKHAVLFLLRAIAAPCDTLVHQGMLQLFRWHREGRQNWLTHTVGWVRRWDSRFGLRVVHSHGGWGWDSLCFVPTVWDERAPQRRWRFPGTGWNDPGNQCWLTADCSTDDVWRTEWLRLVGWARRVADRYAAWEKAEFFLREQFGRLACAGPYNKGRLLHAMWLAGSAIGLRLPLARPNLPSPAVLLDGVAGAARRSTVARFLSGDLDLAAYSSNWDICRGLPSRCCAYCYARYHTAPFIEDEWHFLLICPLYDSFRKRLPVVARDVLVEGHVLQGGGCTPRNLSSLTSALLRLPDPNVLAEYLMRAVAARRHFREKL
jgi:hypothetical protein